jgi:AAT family amino acid transporter
MCCTVTVWLLETIWERFPFSLIKNPTARRITAFFGIIAIAFAMHFFFYFVQELTFGEAIRGTRRDAAPDWRWLHVGEMAIFLLVPALFLKFYAGNWPNKFSLPVNVLLRTIISAAAGIVLYYLYYRFGHLVLGTQKGFSHPQQFPMIPTIWLINIWLVNHWFMDNWPGWKMVPKTAEEIAAEEKAMEEKISEIKWSSSLGLGIGAGAVIGMTLYFITIRILPFLYEKISIIPN